MCLNLRLSPSLHKNINGNLEIQLSGRTIKECLSYARYTYPDIKNILWRDNHINPQLLLFHNNTLIRENDFLKKVTTHDVLDIIPAIEAG